MSARQFQFFAPLSFFEKASAPEGEKRRFGGVISTELRDKQKEWVLQRGLDFSYFLNNGWFNDNHSKETADVLGYPESVLKFRKGDVLPDGSTAAFNGTWAEGHLLETPKANRIWELANALSKAGNKRRLGFSVEGQILERTGPNNNVVAKALVRNVAITNCPVGEETRLEVLAKSLEEVEKGMTAGAATPGVNPSAAGDVTGEGAGKVLAPQSLESNQKDLTADDEEDESEDKPLQKSLAVAHIQNRLGCDRGQAERAYAALINLKQQGLLL